MPNVEVNGASLHYQSAGQGPALVLLHGLTANLAFWYPAVVAGLAPRYTVIVPDLRGHGRSETPPAGYTTRDMASDVEGLLDHLNVGRAHVVGHSYGGAVALHLAALRPERVAGLVLADVRVRSLQPRHEFRRWGHWRVIRDALAESGIRLDESEPDCEFRLLEELARRRLSGGLNGLKQGAFFVPFLNGSSRRAEQWLKLVAETTAIEDFKSVAGLTPELIREAGQPALAIYGEMSHCLPSLRALTGLLPNGKGVLVKSVGHFHPLLKPRLFLYHVRRFLRRAEAQRPPREARHAAGA